MTKQKIIIFYLKFRAIVFVVLGLGLCGALFIIATAIKRESGLYLTGLFLLFPAIEVLLLKCPYCFKRPMSYLKGLPDSCPHCNMELPSAKNILHKGF